MHWYAQHNMSEAYSKVSTVLWKSAPHNCTVAHLPHAQLTPAPTYSSGAKEYEGRPAWLEQRRATNTKQQRGALWKQVISLPKPLKGGSQLSSTHGRLALAHPHLFVCSADSNQAVLAWTANNAATTATNPG